MDAGSHAPLSLPLNDSWGPPTPTSLSWTTRNRGDEEREMKESCNRKNDLSGRVSHKKRAWGTQSLKAAYLSEFHFISHKIQLDVSFWCLVGSVPGSVSQLRVHLAKQLHALDTGRDFDSEAVFPFPVGRELLNPLLVEEPTAPSHAYNFLLSPSRLPCMEDFVLARETQ